jgi:hypothetical protein
LRRRRGRHSGSGSGTSRRGRVRRGHARAQRSGHQRVSLHAARCRGSGAGARGVLCEGSEARSGAWKEGNSNSLARGFVCARAAPACCSGACCTLARCCTRTRVGWRTRSASLQRRRLCHLSHKMSASAACTMMPGQSAPRVRACAAMRSRSHSAATHARARHRLAAPALQHASSVVCIFQYSSLSSLRRQ